MLGGANSDRINDITVNDGKIYIAGGFSEEATFGDKTLTQSNGSDGFLVKLEETKLEPEKEKALVTLSVDSNSITEVSKNQITYTFTREGDINTELPVDFSVAGTAIFNEDYTLTGTEEINGSKGKINFKAEEKHRYRYFRSYQ